MKPFQKEEVIVGYVFVTPALIGLGLFVIVPMLWALYLSFHSWDLLSPPNFIGFSNYLSLFKDSLFISSMRQTLFFSAMVVPLLFFSSLFLAILLNQKFIKGKNAFRLCFFSPVVVSMVVASIIWMFIYDPSFGFANFILTRFGIPPQRWLTSVNQALPSIVIVTVWKAVGYYMLIFLAGLQTIPKEFYEAATIDGATGWQRFRYITFPLLKGTSIFVIVMTTIDSMRTFTQVYVMTQGGPAKSTYVLAMHIYRTAFVFLKMGYASTMAVILFLLIFLLVFIERKYLREEST